MIRTGVLALAAGMVLSLPPAARADQAASTRPAPAEGLAVESLCHSANHLKFLPEAAARQYRLRALAALAADLQPGSPQAADLLALIYRSSPDPSAPLGEALETLLSSRPHDFGLGWQWLGVRVGRTHTARERIALLSETADRASLATELRAEAAAQAGIVLEREGDADKARTLFAQALSLDAWNVIALSRTGNQASDRPAQVRRLVRLLQASAGEATPGDPGPALPLAGILDAAGLHEKSLSFFEEAWRQARRSGQADVLAALAVPYLNALLDAGEAKTAVTLFEPLEKDFADSVDFRSLLAEAYLAANDPAARDREIAAIEKLCPPAAPGAMTASYAVELAMFHLLLQPAPAAAMTEATQAQQGADKDPDQRRRAQRVLGAAELASGKSELFAAGEKRLKALLGQDTYAAAFLAAHYFATAREAAGKETLLAAVPTIRSGPAFRRLRAMAREHAVVLPEAADAAAIRAELAQFDLGSLQMRAFPQRYVSVTLKPVSDSFAPGEAIVLEARLTNTSKAPVALGGAGLLVPTLALRARAVPGLEKALADLPLVVWPAPRMLAPGASLREVVRVDVGPLANFRHRRPLEDLDVTIDGVISPDGEGKSQVPDVVFAPARFHRTDLLGSFDRRTLANRAVAYEQALARIVTAIRGGSVPERMLAARQTAMLLGLAKNVQTGAARPPLGVQENFNKPLLLRMMITLLQDADEVVRAEMLTALQDVPLDETILRQLGPPLIEDASPLVRLRLVELMGAFGLTGPGSIVRALASDPNGRAKMMAEGFLRASGTRGKNE
ncbi:MAG: hypothetical protein NTV86_13380 [Planctomycetota bacterium]|nr:hypothetical protein [Planctomycetota bacterium]